MSAGVLIFKNNDDAGRLYVVKQHEWFPKKDISKVSNQNPRKFYYDDNSTFIEWGEKIRQKQIVAGSVSDISKDVRAIFEQQGILSIIAIPIFVEETWWGIMFLEDFVQERVWSDAEKDSLSAGADILGATIARQQIQDALLEAKATLEQRVEERTRELKDQVTARQQALAKLAEGPGVSCGNVPGPRAWPRWPTGVLHNVGNVLNSVNVSCDLIMDQVRESRVANITKLADLMAAHSPGEFGPVFFQMTPGAGRSRPT